MLLKKLVRAENCVFILLCAALFSQVTLTAQTPVPPVPLWPPDNKPPRDLQGNYVFWDQPAHEAVVVIPGALRGEPDRATEIVRVPFKNRLDPQVAVSVSRVDPDRYRYVYSLANGSAAKDPVTSWTIVVPSNDPQFGIEARTSGWHGGKGRLETARQYALPYIAALGHPLICSVDGQQTPGSASGQVTVVSGDKPGFVTVSASNYPPFQVPRDWPEVILYSQLVKLGDFAWSDIHRVTIGPRFGMDTPATAIAADFLEGLKELIRTGRLSGDSGFVRELQGTLTRAAQDGGKIASPIAAGPSTALEREILSAVRLTFGLEASAR